MSADTAAITAAINLGKIELDSHVEADVIILETARDGLKEDLQNEKDELLVTANEVIATGNAQVAAVKTKGNEVKAEVESILENSEATGNALSLSGKTREQYDAEITSNTEQIQNCLVELGTDDKPLVYAFDPKNGATGGSSTQMSNQISQGNGTCLSDGNGLDGVIDEDGSFYCGEGYENKLHKKQDISLWKYAGDHTVVNHKDYQNISGTSAKFTLIQLQLDEYNPILLNLKLNVKIKIRNNGNKDIKIRTGYSTHIVNPNKTLLLDDIITGNGTTWLTIAVESIAIGDVFNFDIWNDKQVAESNYPVSYVQNTAPKGRVVINEPWTTETHSFIMYGVTQSRENPFSNSTLLMMGDSFGSKNEERFSLRQESKIGEKYTALLSKLFSSALYEDIEKKIIIESQGVGSEIVSLALNENINRTGIDSFEGLFIYEGNLTEIELRSELAKIKSGKYIIPQEFIGTPHQIPYIPKKADSYGLTYSVVEVDENRDLEVLEKETRWEILKLSDDTVSYASVKKVNDIWTINGALDNVSGMIRTQYAAKIRRL